MIDFNPDKLAWISGEKLLADGKISFEELLRDCCSRKRLAKLESQHENDKYYLPEEALIKLNFKYDTTLCAYIAMPHEITKCTCIIDKQAIIDSPYANIVQQALIEDVDSQICNEASLNNLNNGGAEFHQNHFRSPQRGIFDYIRGDESVAEYFSRIPYLRGIWKILLPFKDVDSFLNLYEISQRPFKLRCQLEYDHGLTRGADISIKKPLDLDCYPLELIWLCKSNDEVRGQKDLIMRIDFPGYAKPQQSQAECSGFKKRLPAVLEQFNGVEYRLIDPKVEDEFSLLVGPHKLSKMRIGEEQSRTLEFSSENMVNFFYFRADTEFHYKTPNLLEEGQYIPFFFDEKRFATKVYYFDFPLVDKVFKKRIRGCIRLADVLGYKYADNPL